MFRAFSPKNLPYSYLQSLAVSLPSAGIQNSSYWYSVPQRVQEECVWIHPPLHCCSAPICTHFMGLGDPLEEAHRDICLPIPTTFQTKVFWCCWHIIITVLGCLDPAMVQMRLDPKCTDTGKALLAQQLKLKRDTVATRMSDQLSKK